MEPLSLGSVPYMILIYYLTHHFILPLSLLFPYPSPPLIPLLLTGIQKNLSPPSPTTPSVLLILASYFSHTYHIDLMRINVLGDIIMLPSNVLLVSTHSRRLHRLSYGWVHPYDICIPPGLFYSNLVGNRLWRPPSARRRQGVTTHVSDTNMRTDWANAFKKSVF